MKSKRPSNGSSNVSNHDRIRSTASAVLEVGSLIEMLYRPEDHRTLFAVMKDGVLREEIRVEQDGLALVPYSPRNNLLEHDVVLFPSGPAEYDTTEDLLREIQAFIHT